MAYRLINGSSAVRSLFKKIPNANLNKVGSVRHGSVFPEPSVPWLEKPSCVFSWPAVKHHWGALPVIIICTVGFGLEILAIMRLAVTRDDVWWTKSSGACDYVETRPGYKAPIRKFVVINQKYENPPCLIKALQGDVEGPGCYCEEEEEEVKPGVNKKILIAHAIVGLVALAFIYAV